MLGKNMLIGAALCAAWSLEAAVVLDASRVPGRGEWAGKSLVPLMEEWHPKIVARLDGEDAAVPPEDIRILLEQDGDAPAWTTGRDIHLNMKWAEKDPNDALGAMIHELAHVVQNYRVHRPPSWLAEGIADWVRWFNYEPREEREKQRRLAERSRKHNAAYRVTAAYLDWIAATYDRDFVRKLNLICRAGEYNGAKTWEKLVGRTQEALANEWRFSMPPREKPAEAFDVATYNLRRSGDKGIYSWKVRFPQLLGVIATRRFDLIGFQEVNPDQMADLKSGLYGWEAIGTGRNADGGGEASPIFWRADRFEKLGGGMFWMSETPEKPGSRSWNAQFPRVCSWVKLRDRVTGKSFAYFNCHTDHASIRARQESMRLVLRRIKEYADGLPVVFGGDLNDEVVDDRLRAQVEKRDGTKLSPATPDHPVNIVKTVLKDSFEITETPHMGSDWTDNGYRKKHVKRIDYLFVSDGIRVLTHETTCDRPNGIFPSDHESVVARLVLGFKDKIRK